MIQPGGRHKTLGGCGRPGQAAWGRGACPPTPSGPQEAGWSFRPGLASAHSWAPRVNQSRQCGSSLIKVQGFNRSFKNPKLLPPPAQPPGPLPPVHGSSRPAPMRPGRAKVPAYSRRTAAAERDQHSQLHLICPETGWR